MHKSYTLYFSIKERGRSNTVLHGFSHWGNSAVGRDLVTMVAMNTEYTANVAIVIDTISKETYLWT